MCTVNGSPLAPDSHAPLTLLRLAISSHCLIVLKPVGVLVTQCCDAVSVQIERWERKHPGGVKEWQSRRYVRRYVSAS